MYHNTPIIPRQHDFVDTGVVTVPLEDFFPTKYIPTSTQLPFLSPQAFHNMYLYAKTSH